MGDFVAIISIVIWSLSQGDKIPRELRNFTDFKFLLVFVQNKGKFRFENQGQGIKHENVTVNTHNC